MRRQGDCAASRAGTATRLMLGFVMLLVAAGLPGPTEDSARASESDEVQIALNLAKLLQSGRTVISANQALINDPSRGDKGLTGDVVLAATIDKYRKATGVDPTAIDPVSRESRLLRAELASIKEVVDENQKLINEAGVRLKGFITASFGGPGPERPPAQGGSGGEMTAHTTPALVPNRTSRSDE